MALICVSGLIPAFLVQFTTVFSSTASHDLTIMVMAFNIDVVGTAPFLSIARMVRLTVRCQYFAFKDLITPGSIRLGMQRCVW